MGISAIYEYAARAIGANRWDANFEVRKIAVGPSAPPIIAMDAASAGSNPNATARMNAQ